ncbi:MAG: hypothetical protein WCP86_11965 [bacterium]
MTYLDQWKALSSRIHGLTKAGHLHAQYLAVQSSDTYGRGKRLLEQSKRVLTALQSFQDTFRQKLSSSALTAIDDFVASSGTLIEDTTGTSNSLQERGWAALVLLAAFETEMSFLLSDAQESIRSRAERAFSHLQRSIVVDEDLRAKWKKAYEEGEVACEKLGAVHLLLHGIWAFKINATGARTDLVFQEPAGDLIATQRYADGLVLTEWKKAVENSQPSRLFEEARIQANRYAQGPLGATELTEYRYAVVVSSIGIETPDDLMEGGILYRHINIAVAPRTPSRP